MDNLAEQMDRILGRLERAGMKNCAPKLNPTQDPKTWLSNNAAPWAKLANEKPKGETVSYEQLLQAWQEGRATLAVREHLRMPLVPGRDLLIGAAVALRNA